MVETWPNFGFDPGHSGHGRGQTPPDGPVQERWRHSFDGKFAYCSPVIGSSFNRGILYVTVRQTQVYAATVRAIGADDGKLVWALREDEGYGFTKPPSTGNNRLVLPESWVINTETGRVIYAYRDPYEFPHRLPTTVVGGRIHYGDQALDLETGEVVWKAESSGNPDRDGFGAVAVNGETAYYSGLVRRRDGNTPGLIRPLGGSTFSRQGVGKTNPKAFMGFIRAVDADTGQHRWVTEFGISPSFPNPPVASEESVYVMDRGATLRAFDATTGEQRWSTALDGNRVSWRRPAVAEGHVFVEDAHDELLAIDATDGSEMWVASLDDEIAGTPAVVDGAVYLTDVSGGVYSVNMAGKRRWKLSLDERIGGGPIIADGRIYVAGYYLFCLDSPA